MALTKRWTNFSLKLHTKTAQAAAAVYIDGIRSQGVNNNLQTLTDGADGSVFNTFGSLVSGAPAAQFNTTDLKALLDEISVDSGMLIDTDGSHPGVVMTFSQMAQGGTRTPFGTAQHFVSTIGSGMLVPTTLQASHQGSATIAANILARQEGAVAPIVFDGTAAHDDVAPEVDTLHTLGPIDLNATVVDGVQSVSVDFGIRTVVEGADSDIFPTFVSVVRTQPRITITGAHIDIIDALTNEGAFYAVSTVRIFLKHRAEGGTYAIDAAATHILLTLGKCRVEVQSVAGNPKAVNLTLTPWYTVAGTVSPITVNTAVAIT